MCEPLKNKIKRVWITFSNPDVEDIITWSEVDILSKKDVKSAVNGLKKEIDDIFDNMPNIHKYGIWYDTDISLVDKILSCVNKWFEDVIK